MEVAETNALMPPVVSHEAYLIVLIRYEMCMLLSTS